MRSNKQSNLKSLIRNKKELIGSFIKTPNYQLVEIASLSNLSFIILDAEHAPFDREQLDIAIMAAKSKDIPILVRVPKISDEYILSVLDQGADGILVPHINTFEDAEAAVAATKFLSSDCPTGRRGFSNSSRAGDYGGLSINEMIHLSNNSSVIICQIEEKQAVDNIDKIINQQHIDCLFIGMADLAISLGCSELNDPKVINAIDHVVLTANKNNICLGIYIADKTNIDMWRKKGFTFFVVGSDQSHLMHAFNNLIS
jgi:2-keto-3-deoxy-L-rhamnonate aldolase RhmA